MNPGRMVRAGELEWRSTRGGVESPQDSRQALRPATNVLQTAGRLSSFQLDGRILGLLGVRSAAASRRC